MNPKYSWQSIFDEIKKLNGRKAIIKLKTKKRYCDPETPKDVRGYCNMYVRYEASTDTLVIWAYSGNIREYHDLHDGSWGWESELEKFQGRRNRLGEWVEPLTSTFNKLNDSEYI